MKLKQKEYCHNCNQYVIYEFEDITDRQVIICPKCGHQHYRELDEGTIINIRVNQGEKTLRIAKMPDLCLSSIANPDEDPLESDIQIEEREIMGADEKGNTIVKSKNGEKSRKYISERRWGRDPRQ